MYRANVHAVDEGLPISYEVLESGVAVYSADGEQIGAVDHVIAAVELDIFHGIVIRTGGTRRFVAADQVASLHEHGVDLRINAAAASALPPPEGAAPAWRVREPGAPPSTWNRIVDMVSGADRGRRDWRDEE
jgi:hypothetical protein